MEHISKKVKFDSYPPRGYGFPESRAQHFEASANGKHLAKTNEKGGSLCIK